jgi:hypothetical protein
VLKETLAGRQQGDTTTVSRQQRNTKCNLHAANARARGGQGKVRPLGTVRDAARLGNMKEKPQIHEIETHQDLLRNIRSLTSNSTLRAALPWITVWAMLDPILIFVGVVFALAGSAKGAIGLGLPTISMGLLAVVMPPVRAAAILILPSSSPTSGKCWRAPR